MIPATGCANELDCVLHIMATRMKKAVDERTVSVTDGEIPGPLPFGGSLLAVSKNCFPGATTTGMLENRFAFAFCV